MKNSAVFMVSFLTIILVCAIPGLTNAGQSLNSVSNNSESESSFGELSKDGEPITRGEIISTAKKLSIGRRLTQRDLDILSALREAVNTHGSGDLTDFLSDQTEAFVTGSDWTVAEFLFYLMNEDEPNLQFFEDEMVAIVDLFPEAKNTGRTPGNPKGGPAIPIIIGAGVCGMGIAACESDAMTQFDFCLAGDFCGDGEVGDSQCCYDVYEGDILNCWATCGTNGPDGDGSACCVDNSGVGQGGAPSS